MSELVLRAEELSKRFDGNRVLDDVSMEVRAHEVVGVLGENGAGKSTLLKMLSGFCRPDSGRIVLRGKTVTFRGVSDALAAGITLACQDDSLLPNLSVAENIMLGHEDAALRFGFLYDWNALHRLTKSQLKKLDLGFSPSVLTGTLSIQGRRMIALAKVLTIEERTQEEPVILLDEVTSILDSEQTETVLRHVESIRERASVVFVSHRLDEVRRLCDRIYILNDGRCVAQVRRGEGDSTGLQQFMLEWDRKGDRRTEAPAGLTSKPSCTLSVRELSRANRYQAVSFDLRDGEVLGIAGTRSSGRESLCRTLFGAEESDSGEIMFEGKPVSLAGPADAVHIGIGYLPAERLAEGIVAGLSVRENMTLAHLDPLLRGPVIDVSRERELVTHWIERLGIKTPTPESPASSLSGGNQQKLMLAKWLIAQTPKVLILEHPLRGLDVAGRMQITALIHELARTGIGIVLITDSLEELITLSDRIIVMKDGAVKATFDTFKDKPSELEILDLMV